MNWRMCCEISPTNLLDIVGCVRVLAYSSSQVVSFLEIVQVHGLRPFHQWNGGGNICDFT